MADSVVESLILDLLEWLASRERSYEDTMEVWRTSCPKLPVWEDANERGLVAIDASTGRILVRLSPAGRELVRRRRPPRPEPLDAGHS